MSNTRLSVLDLTAQQKEDYEFYKKLGFTTEQSLALSYYVFGSSWSNNNAAIKGILHVYNEVRNKMPFSEFFVEHVKMAEQFAREAEEKRRQEQEDMPLLNEIIRKNNIPSSKPPKKESKAMATGLKGLFTPSQRETGRGSSASYSYSMSSLRSLSSHEAVEACYAVEPEMSAHNGYAPLLSPSPVNPFTIADTLTKGADTESYHHIEEKGFQKVSDSPTSSFRTTCNTASIGNIMNQLRHGRYIKPDSVRIEELMNFFDYDMQTSDEVINIHAEICDKPNSNNKLLFVGVKGKEESLKRQNIVLLLDTSGSMESNRHIMKKTMMTIVSKMQEGDTLSLITYSNQDHTIYHGLKISKESIETIIEKMLEISITGCTNGSAGIETAYKYAADYFIEDGINKVILMTDGDLNFGINSNNGLEKLILEKKKTNVFLSVIGMGIWNYKDDKLEVLAKNGNGNYCAINDSWELEEIVLKRYNAIINTIAKDVKAQVEFNPAKVKSYRLLGYENRTISRTEFNDDKVIAEPFCSGSVCVAMYELEMADGQVEDTGLKYQSQLLNDSSEFCTVSVRYKLPMEEESKLLTKAVDREGDFSDNIKLAFVCYAIGEKFRDSKFNDLKDELMARYISETFENGKVAELNGDKLNLLKVLSRKHD